MGRQSGEMVHAGTVKTEFRERIGKPCTRCGGRVGEAREVAPDGITLPVGMIHKDDLDMLSPVSIDDDCPRG